MDNTPISLYAAMDAIESCNFECAAGPLNMHVAWVWLRAQARELSPFFPGQAVWFEVSAEAHGFSFSAWKRFYVCGMRAASSNTERYWEYDISTALPDAYFAGGKVIRNVRANMLRAEKPALKGPARAALEGE